MGAYFGAFAKSFQFAGRAPRREYWFFVLFDLIALVALVIASEALGGNVAIDSSSYGGGDFIYQQVTYLRVPVAIYLVVSFFARLSITVRRLHDRNWSGWAILLAVIPLLGGLLLFIQFVQPGARAVNRFGADPLASNGRASAAPASGPTPAHAPAPASAPRADAWQPHPVLMMALGAALVGIAWFGWSQRAAIMTALAVGPAYEEATADYDYPSPATETPAETYAETYAEPAYDSYAEAPAAEYAEPAYDTYAETPTTSYAEPAYDTYAETPVADYAEPAYDSYAEAPVVDYDAAAASYAAPPIISIDICNQTSVGAAVAAAYVPLDQSTWLNEGWWVVDANSCATIASTSNAIFYLYAEERDGGGMVWQGDHGSCVTYPGPFSTWDDGAEYCPDGYETVSFTEIRFDNPESGGVYTWYLDPAY